MRKSKKIYLDYASSASTANPGAIHDLGVKARNTLEKARSDIAKILGAHADEVIFTSGATEANNLAILGIMSRSDLDKPHIITTNIEHASVLETCKYLQKTKQAEVTFLEVEKNGILDPKKLRKAFRPNTVLVSVMHANNEIGTIQSIREIAKEIRHYNKINGKKVLFHTDATQVMNYLSINVEKLGVDLLSFNGAKIYGPAGVGVLFKRRKVMLVPIMHGGDQEFGLRPGTENVQGAIELASALEITEKMKEKEVKRLVQLRDYFIKKLLALDEKIILNGDPVNRLPNNVNITIPKIPSDLLVLELSARGIYVSEKSACKSGDVKSSHVIRAICKKDENSLRFSLGRGTTKSDIGHTLKALAEILKKLKGWYS